MAFANLNGSSTEVFRTATAISGNDAVNLALGDSRYASINGNSAIPFSIGAATNGNHAVRYSDIEAVIASIGGLWIQSGSNIYYNAGNVGIGIINPNSKVDIFINSDISGINIYQSKNSGGFSSVLKIIDDRGFSNVNNGSAIEIKSWYTGNDTGYLFRSYTSTDGFVTNIEALNVKLNGNVGIGVANPLYKLHIKEGDQFIQNTLTDTVFYIGEGFGSNQYGSLSWDITNKNLTLGTTGSGVGSLRISGFSGTEGNIGLGINPSYQLHLSTDNAAKLTTNTWIVTSDKRMKKDIELADLDICYNTIKNIPLKRFGWKYYDETQAPDQNILGWIAQDVQEVFPKAVQECKLEIQKEIKDENGNIIQERQVLEDGLTLNSDQILKALYGAVQKLQNIVELQANEINELKSFVNFS